jgi:hypothetical protein
MQLVHRIRCAAEILDDFIPTCRQHGDIYVGVREIVLEPKHVYDVERGGI